MERTKIICLSEDWSENDEKNIWNHKGKSVRYDDFYVHSADSWDFGGVQSGK